MVWLCSGAVETGLFRGQAGKPGAEETSSAAAWEEPGPLLNKSAFQEIHSVCRLFVIIQYLFFCSTGLRVVRREREREREGERARESKRERERRELCV